MAGTLVIVFPLYKTLFATVAARNWVVALECVKKHRTKNMVFLDKILYFNYLISTKFMPSQINVERTNTLPDTMAPKPVRHKKC